MFSKQMSDSRISLHLVSETLDPNHPIAILHTDIIWNNKLSVYEKSELEYKAEDNNIRDIDNLNK